MLDDTPVPDPHDDPLYLRYLVTCAALGVKPVSVERARELIDEWGPVIGDAMRRDYGPQRKH
jgi:hypothetical protein